jgi:5'-nucleotidase
MITILQTNDFHGKLTVEVAERIRALKDESDALYFDCGDAIKTGNLGVPLKREVAWERLALAGCDAGVPGNRESHVLSSVLEAKLEGAQHPLLCANMAAKNGRMPAGIQPNLILEKGGLRLGVFGVMVPMVTSKMATQAASAYLWTSPIAAAREQVVELRPQVDRVIALTHIGVGQDRALAEACPEIALIFGGHSHSVLAEPERVGDTLIFQAGSHGRFLGRYRFDDHLQLLGAELLAL